MTATIEAGCCQCGCGKATELATKTRCGNTKGQPRKFLRGHGGRRKSRPSDPDSVESAGLRAALQRSETPTATVAQRMGMLMGGQGPRAAAGDGGALEKVLGIRPYARGGPLRTHISYDMAVRIVRAMDLDPIDYDV